MLIKIQMKGWIYMEMRRRQPIGVELVKRGVVTSEDIERALQ